MTEIITPDLPPRLFSPEKTEPDVYRKALQDEQESAARELQRANMERMKARTESEKAELDARRSEAEARKRKADADIQRFESGEGVPGSSGFKVSGNFDMGGFLSQSLAERKEEVQDLKEQVSVIATEAEKTKFDMFAQLMTQQISDLKGRLSSPTSAPSSAEVFAQLKTLNEMIKDQAKEIIEAHPREIIREPEISGEVRIQLQTAQHSHDIALATLQAQMADNDKKWALELKKFDIQLAQYQTERQDKKDERDQAQKNHREMLGYMESLLTGISKVVIAQGAGGVPEVPAMAVRSTPADSPNSNQQDVFKMISSATCDTPGCGYKFPVQAGMKSVVCPKCNIAQELSWPEPPVNV